MSYVFHKARTWISDTPSHVYQQLDAQNWVVNALVWFGSLDLVGPLRGTSPATPPPSTCISVENISSNMVWDGNLVIEACTEVLISAFPSESVLTVNRNLTNARWRLIYLPTNSQHNYAGLKKNPACRWCIPPLKCVTRVKPVGWSQYLGWGEQGAEWGLWEWGSWFSAWDWCGWKFTSSHKGLLPQVRGFLFYP